MIVYLTVNRSIELSWIINDTIKFIMNEIYFEAIQLFNG